MLLTSRDHDASILNSFTTTWVSQSVTDQHRSFGERRQLSLMILQNDRFLQHLTGGIAMKLKVLITSLLMTSTLSLSSYADSAMTVDQLAVSLNTVWVLIAGFLVFIMHAGFTCVEVGFSQAKNSVNIIMKNIMTVSIGVLMYYLMGFALMFGQDNMGLIGTSGFLLSNPSQFDFGIPLEAFWFFQAVFAATCATIVSGAMAERTRFSAYLYFTVLVTAIVYPVVGHWIWGGGWLSRLGFIDFAGSTVVHGVGGVSALIGAWLVGPRVGKYDGKTVNAIMGHNIPLGAIGVLLLWFGWFGFNPGSTLSGTNPDIAVIAVTTLLAGASAMVSSMLFSWHRYGKPDVSLTLNGCLAGLVAITAGCQAIDPIWSVVIGLAVGIVMIFSVEFFDKVARIDDPVGAISVHGVCGGFGTLMVGFFAREGGLFTGGGFHLLQVQALGFFSVILFVGTMTFAVFTVIKTLVGLRLTDNEQNEGLDLGEHGVTAYSQLERSPYDGFVTEEAILSK